ncbi:META domain-containing protein [Geojedonia litorea]|uniref:META domain-containing protein n=1 Tax=Geojedonia litorea TaxID=1268269 RepID=A0ABV9N0E4_9FLAO
MRKIILFLTSILAFSLVSCISKKQINQDNLYKTTWELEYILEPQTPFNDLYPNKKPEISFNNSTNKVEGNNSCNGYSADYILKDNQLSFGEPGPTTMMYCGDGEKVFLDMMKKINRFDFDQSGKLNLMVNEVLIMRFKSVEPH